MRRNAKRLGVLFLCASALFSAAPIAITSAAEPLKTIVESYLRIHAQLAADKTDGVKPAATEIVKQAEAMGSGGAAIAKAAGSVAAAGDLKTAREAFGPLSDAVKAAVDASGPASAKELGLKLAFCPMVNRSWLQKEEKLRNPYYGSAMLECGEFKK
jgi:hypothetical protein